MFPQKLRSSASCLALGCFLLFWHRNCSIDHPKGYPKTCFWSYGIYSMGNKRWQITKHIESQMNSGSRLSRYCHRFLLNVKVVVHLWTIERQWKPCSMSCAQDANGMRSREIWEQETQYMNAFRIGGEPVCSTVCGRLASWHTRS